MSSSENSLSLTGVWHGLYTYPSHPHMPESHFVCVLIDVGGALSGTIHEDMQQYRQPSVKANASVDGHHSGTTVAFVKTYDGTGGQSHSVQYIGLVSGERDEIEGDWHVQNWLGRFSGRFLMIRKRGQGEAAETEAVEHAR